MNWTGGRLQRSKANANTLVKTQKQHFAKARLRLQNGQSSQSQLAFSIAHGQHGFGTEMQDDKHFDEHYRRRTRPHSQEIIQGEVPHAKHCPRSKRRHKDSRIEPQAKRRRSAESTYHRNGNIAATKTKPTQRLHDTEKETRPPNLASVVHPNRKSAAAEANTLQKVKRDLLKKSDWMGLSAARPLTMAFTSVEEMENIGKRRRITEADGSNKAAAPCGSRFHIIFNRYHRIDQNGSNASILPTEDASVRIGTNIHQTQTTPLLSNEESSIPKASQSASTEYMLLDKFDQGAPQIHQVRGGEENRGAKDVNHPLSLEISTQDDTSSAVSYSNRVGRVKESRFPYDRAHASSAEELSDTEIGQILPTLDDLRDSKSFDELKTRSATNSSEGLALPSMSLRRLTGQKEATQKGHNVNDSSSIVNGRGLLQHCMQRVQSAGGAGAGKQVPALSDISRDSQAAWIDPTKLSSGFWPERPSQSGSQPDVDIADRGSPCGPEGQPNSPEGLGMCVRPTVTDDAAHSEPSSQSSIRRAHVPQPIFTLEQQVYDEAGAKTQMDALNGSVFELRKDRDSKVTLSSTTKSNHSWIRSPARPSRRGGVSALERAKYRKPGEAVASSNPAGHATESGSESLEAISGEDGSLNLWGNEKQMISQEYFEEKLDPGVMPRLSRAASINDALGTRHIQHDGNGPSNTALHTPWRDAGRGGHENESEALMESTIPGFAEIRNAFEFEPTVRRQTAHCGISGAQSPTKARDMARVNKLTWRTPLARVAQNTSPAKSIQTSANTILYAAENLCSPQPTAIPQPSETDFLTQMSPMEGKLDERLTSISVHNNVARSVRSLVTAPSWRTHSGRPLEEDVDPIRTSGSGPDTAPFRRPTRGKFPGVQDTDASTWKWRTPKDEHMPGSRAIHRQPLQSSTELLVASSPPFTWRAPVERTAAPTSWSVPGPGLARTYPQRADLAKKTYAEKEALRTSRRLMSSFPLFTPVRGKPPDIGLHDHSRTYPVQSIQGNL